MINFDDYANENKTEHNSRWLYIPDHPYRILIVRGSGSGTKCLIKFNLINNQSDIDICTLKIHMKPNINI